MSQSIDNIHYLCYYVDMVNKIKNIIYGYEKDEFLPIYVEGALANRNEFVLYKTKKATGHIINALDRAYHAAGGMDGLK